MSGAWASAPLRIAVANWTGRLVGGVETYLAAVMPELVARGHELALVAEHDAPGDRQPLPLPSGMRRWFAEAGHDGLLAGLREWAPDVVFAHGLMDPALEARIASVAPVVFVAHNYFGTCISGTKAYTFPDRRPCESTFGPGCMAHYFPRRCGGSSPVTMVQLYRKQSRRLGLIRGYAEVLTLSDHMRREYERHGIAARCAGGIVQALDQPADVPAAERVDHGPRERAPDEPWRLLFVGRMDRLKGGDLALAALPRAAAALGRPVCLTMVGEGPDRPRLEALARKVTSPRVSVTFAGWQSARDVRATMRGQDLLVAPTVSPEPFGLVGAEAGLEGLPAAGFAVGGIPEWLIAGVSGELAPGDPPTSDGLADAIVRSLVDPAHHAALRAGARRHASTLTLDRHVAVVEASLRRAAATGRATSALAGR